MRGQREPRLPTTPPPESTQLEEQHGKQGPGTRRTSPPAQPSGLGQATCPPGGFCSPRPPRPQQGLGLCIKLSGHSRVTPCWVTKHLGQLQAHWAPFVLLHRADPRSHDPMIPIPQLVYLKCQDPQGRLEARGRELEGGAPPLPCSRLAVLLRPAPRSPALGKTSQRWLYSWAQTPPPPQSHRIRRDVGLSGHGHV